MGRALFLPISPPVGRIRWAVYRTGLTLTSGPCPAPRRHGGFKSRISGHRLQLLPTRVLPVCISRPCGHHIRLPLRPTWILVVLLCRSLPAVTVLVSVDSDPSVVGRIQRRRKKILLHSCLRQKLWSWLNLTLLFNQRTLGTHHQSLKPSWRDTLTDSSLRKKRRKYLVISPNRHVMLCRSLDWMTS